MVETSGAFYQCADGLMLQADQELPFPVPRDRPVPGHCGPFADQHLGRHMCHVVWCAHERGPQCSTGAQAGR